MCSIDDSDATYCSEVEEIIKMTTVPLRRSQRLSQKLKQPLKFSWDNVRISNSGLTIAQKYKPKSKQSIPAGNCSQNLFSTQDLREDLENWFPPFKCQQHHVVLSDEGCKEKSAKLLESQKGVPLDLLKKSKESGPKTPLGKLNDCNELKTLQLQSEHAGRGARKIRGRIKKSSAKNNDNFAKLFSEVQKMPKTGTGITKPNNIENNRKSDSTIKSLTRFKEDSKSIENDSIGNDNGIPAKKMKLSHRNMASNPQQNETNFMGKISKTINEIQTKKEIKETTVIGANNKQLITETQTRNAIKEATITGESNKELINEVHKTKVMDIQITSKQKDSEIIKRRISRYKESNFEIAKEFNLMHHIKSEPFSSLEIKENCFNETTTVNAIQGSLKDNKPNLNVPKVSIKTRTSQKLSQKSNKVPQTTSAQNNKFSSEIESFKLLELNEKSLKDSRAVNVIQGSLKDNKPNPKAPKVSIKTRTSRNFYQKSKRIFQTTSAPNKKFPPEIESFKSLELNEESSKESHAANGIQGSLKDNKQSLKAPKLSIKTRTSQNLSQKSNKVPQTTSAQNNKISTEIESFNSLQLNEKSLKESHAVNGIQGSLKDKPNLKAQKLSSKTRTSQNLSQKSNKVIQTTSAQNNKFSSLELNEKSLKESHAANGIQGSLKNNNLRINTPRVSTKTTSSQYLSQKSHKVLKTTSVKNYKFPLEINPLNSLEINEHCLKETSALNEIQASFNDDNLRINTTNALVKTSSSQNLSRKSKRISQTTSDQSHKFSPETGSLEINENNLKDAAIENQGSFKDNRLKSNKVPQTHSAQNHKFSPEVSKEIANNSYNVEPKQSEIVNNNIKEIKTTPKTKYTRKTGRPRGNSKQNFENLTKQNIRLHNKTPCKSYETRSLKRSLNKENKETHSKNKKPDPTSFALNKNIMQYFDKTLYLDKIQNSCKYLENLSSPHQNLHIPPTPAETSQDILRKSVLPEIYPPHFKNQLPSSALLTPSLNPSLQQDHHHPHYPSNIITPDETITSELLESHSSSPSLPESLCELLQTKDIEEILNVEKVSYRLYNYHVQALALILNLRLEYLCQILDKVVNMKSNVLRNIDKAVKMPFVRDNDLFANSSGDEMKSSDEFVFNSQSSNRKSRRMSILKERVKC